MCKLVIVAVVTGTATLASATAWQGVTRDVGTLLVYVDADSVGHEGDVRTARVLFDYRDPQYRPASFDEWFRSLEALVTVRCADRSYERREEVMYSDRHGRGKVLAKEHRKAAGETFDKAVPFTNSQSIVDYVCSS